MVSSMNGINNNPMSKGIYFDLALIFQKLNQRFFDEKIHASLKWGQRRSKKVKNKSSIRLGSYHPETKTIVLNPCLDQAMVPTICVERILFHEMLHQHFPIKKGSKGNNLIHYEEFYDFEKKYPYLVEADRWLKANLNKLMLY